VFGQGQLSCLLPQSAGFTKDGTIMEIIREVALISINGTLIAQLLSFLILLFILNRVMIRPLRSAMEERDFHIQKIQKETLEADREYDRLMQKIQKEEAAAVRQGHRARQQIENAGKEEAESMLQKARQEIDSRMRENESEIKVKIGEARQSVEAEAQALAVRMMEKILDRRLGS
jgi:F-type H+-transporting ATPase subunit b